MYVFCCNGVTDREIKRSIEMKEIQTLRELNNKFGMGKQCGKCETEVRKIFNESVTREHDSPSRQITLLTALA